MKKYRRGAWDMSSFIWTHLSVGKDGENGYEVEHEGKRVYINSAQYGFDNVMDRMLNLLKEFKLQPIDCILVFEGLNSKGKRLLIDNQYKGGGGPSRPPEAYAEFEKLREMLKVAWKDLGAQTMWQDFAEGDDTLAWLAFNTEDDLIVFTFDNDLTALNLHQNAHGARVSTWINQMFEHCKYGTFDYHLVTTYKALVGDSSDNIKGCPGFGPKKFDALCEQYGHDGLAEIHAMLLRSDLSPLADYISGPQDKLLQMILDNAPQVIRCFDLARLRPEWVNTMRQPLHWEPGMVRQLQPTDRDPRLKPWYGRTRLITAAEFKEACAWALPHIRASREVALDIETSTPDESDEWLAALGDPDGVDVFGSELTGLGLTFGPNNQYTFYFSVDHADTDNIASEDLRQFIAQIPQEIPVIIQNVSFELAVLFNEWGARQMDNGYHGFLPNVLDTKFEANYVNENIKTGLKERSHGTLGYRQQTYDETVTLTAHPSDLPKGGRLLREDYQYRTVGTGKFEPLTDEEIAAGVQPMEITKTELVEAPTGRMLVSLVDAKTGEHVEYVPMEDDELECEELDPTNTKPEMAPVVATQTRRYKMRELTARHVLGYGADDPICTIALHNYYKLFMQLEHSWQTCLNVEIDAAYQHAKNFIDGTEVSIARCRELEREDDVTYDNAWATVRQYLIEKGWPGVTPPQYTVDITPAQIKEAYTIVTGETLDTMMRTPSKIVKFIETETEHLQFAKMLEQLVAPHASVLSQFAAEKAFTAYVRSYFKGEPQFNKGSPIQMQKLMYEVMGLPIRVRNMPTDAMKKAGIREGSPKTDLLAVAYALQECGPEEKPVLEALKLMGMVTTRRSLYYSKYPYFTHWKDGRVRSQHNQCSTVTRRASESKPNKQQLPKHQKIDGQEAKFREVIVPHRPGAVIVSMDFDSQEMVLIAFQSQDPNALACFQGEKRKSPHTITALGIVREEQRLDWSYEDYEAALEKALGDEMFKLAKEFRTLGKKVNFVAEYGAMAEKVAATLMISVERAQLFLDAREAMYPVAEQWKQAIRDEVKQHGVVRTLGGGVRHLGDQLLNGTSFEKSKAERQAVNFKVQGPAGEQTKLAEGRMWRDNLSYDFDAVCYGPIHDEVVWSVMIDDLLEFIPRCHAAMTAPFSTMDLEVVSTISFGPNFYRQTEIGAYPTREAIETGLLEMHLGMIKRGETTWEQSWIEDEVEFKEAA